MAADPTTQLSIEQLAEAAHHVRALIASGVPRPHELYHLDEICNRIEAAMVRKRQKEPGAAGEPGLKRP